MEPMFVRYGVPYSLRTDNGPQFISEEFEAFLKEYNIEHRTTPPLWPQANGEVERQNRTLMKALRVAHTEQRDWRKEVNKFLMAYRSTPQASTGATPYYLMFGREMRSKLPDMRPEATVMDEQYRDKDWESKLKGKAYADEKRRAQHDSVKPGDQVLVKAQKTDKLSTNFEVTPQTVVSRKGNEVVVRGDDGAERRRHTTAVKTFVCDSADQTVASEETKPITQTDGRRDFGARPSRQVKPPERFKDFIMK